MPVRNRSNKITKPTATPVRGNRNSPLFYSAAEDHLEQLGQDFVPRLAHRMLPQALMGLGEQDHESYLSHFNFNMEGDADAGFGVPATLENDGEMLLETPTPEDMGIEAGQNSQDHQGLEQPHNVDHLTMNANAFINSPPLLRSNNYMTQPAATSSLKDPVSRRLRRSSYIHDRNTRSSRLRPQTPVPRPIKAPKSPLSATSSASLLSLLSSKSAKMEPGASERTAADIISETFGDKVQVESVLCKRLAEQVALRYPIQRREDQELNMKRRGNVEALLAHITGDAVPRPCKNCHKGHGPWTECVVYEGQMCGSCTNCWFNASGSRCTFHENRNPPPQQQQNTTVAQPAPVVLPGLYGIRGVNSNPRAPAIDLDMPPLHADFRLAGLNDPTGRIVSQAMDGVAGLTRRNRLIARVEAAAQELGMRIAEYDEYIQTPEGRVEHEAALEIENAQEQQMPEPSTDSNLGSP